MRIVYQKKFDYRNLPSQTPDPKMKDKHISKRTVPFSDENFIKSKLKEGVNVVEMQTMLSYEYERNEKGYYAARIVGKLPKNIDGINLELATGYVDLLGDFHVDKSEINQSLIDFYMGKVALKDVDSSMFVGKTGDRLMEFVEKLGVEAVLETAKAKGYDDARTEKVMKKHIEKMKQYFARLKEKKASEVKAKEDLAI